MLAESYLIQFGGDGWFRHAVSFTLVVNISSSPEGAYCVEMPRNRDNKCTFRPVIADDGRSMQVRLSASACWGAEHPSDSQQSILRFNAVQSCGRAHCQVNRQFTGLGTQ